MPARATISSNQERRHHARRDPKGQGGKLNAPATCSGQTPALRSEAGSAPNRHPASDHDQGQLRETFRRPLARCHGISARPADRSARAVGVKHAIIGNAIVRAAGIGPRSVQVVASDGTSLIQADYGSVRSVRAVSRFWLSTIPMRRSGPRAFCVPVTKSWCTSSFRRKTPAKSPTSIYAW